MSNEVGLLVNGDTCSHCQQALREELSRIPGLSRIDVDPINGRVTVTSEGILKRTSVEQAVSEAGFDLVGWQTL